MVGVEGVPSLTLFLWEDGAQFDDVMGRYMSAEAPSGIDPERPEVLSEGVGFAGNSSVVLSVTQRNLSVM